jgi:hypothetical protein
MEVAGTFRFPENQQELQNNVNEWFNNMKNRKFNVLPQKYESFKQP